MRKRLFGFNRKHVDEFIDEMKAGFIKKEYEALKRLETLENEKSELETQLKSLIEEKKSCSERKERLELVLARTHGNASFIYASVKDETEQDSHEAENIDGASDDTKVVTMPERYADYFQMPDEFWDNSEVLKEISAATAAAGEQILVLPEEETAQGSTESAISVQETLRTENSRLTKDIEEIRQRYIVGKLAGEDLYDSNNSLIIAKNQAITADVISRAEREGKLAELIVNMIIPGMELI